MCKNFDVSLGTDGSPFIYLINATKNSKNEKNIHGLWWPICGHFFNDNDHGATLFCKQLNSKYERGIIVDKSMTDTIPMQSVMVGNCTENDTRASNLKSCSGGCNKYGLGRDCANLSCSAGHGQRVKITCILKKEPVPVNITENPVGRNIDRTETENSCQSKRNDYSSSIIALVVLIPNYDFVFKNSISFLL